MHWKGYICRKCRLPSQLNISCPSRSRANYTKEITLSVDYEACYYKESVALTVQAARCDLERNRDWHVLTSPLAHLVCALLGADKQWRAKRCFSSDRPNVNKSRGEILSGSFSSQLHTTFWNQQLARFESECRIKKTHGVIWVCYGGGLVPHSLLLTETIQNRLQQPLSVSCF